MTNVRQWPLETIEAIKREWASGSTLEAIAERYFTDSETVWRLSHRRRSVEKTRHRVLELIETGKTDSEIAEQLIISPMYVYRLRAKGRTSGRNKRQWPSEVVEAMQRDCESGATLKEIATRYEMSPYYVSQLIGKISRGFNARKWSPETITAMRERLAAGATQREVGIKYGISAERVRQLTGKVNRSHPPGWKPAWTGRAEENRKRVYRLVQEGLTDLAIAEATGLDSKYVAILRLRSGVRRVLRHTPQHSLWCLTQWVEEYDYLPAATDWSPSSARKRGHDERAERFEDFRKRWDCPRSGTVQTQFGSWNEFIRQCGYTPRGIGAKKVAWQKTQPQD
jgi:DNA-binding CsgD family transcriptional regulator